MLEYFINTYGNQIMLAILCAVFGLLGMVAKNLAARFLDNETKRTIAKMAAQFVEQAWKDLHGADKLHKALEAAETLLAKQGIKFDADEMKILIEAAVGEFNEAFNSVNILPGIDADDLTDEQMRSVLQQIGFAYTENMTREEMLAALDEATDEAPHL